MSMYIHPLSRERSRHGKLKIYVKEFALDGTGRKVLKQRHPMPDGLIEDTPPFVAAYQAICAKIAGGAAPAADRKAAKAAPEAKVADASDSLDWLIKMFLVKKGPDWSPATRYRVERSLQALRDEKTDAGLPRGVCRFADLRLTHMQDAQDAWVRNHGQGEARLRIQHIKTLFNWAIKKQYFTNANPCMGLDPIKGFSKGKKKRGTVAWKEAEAELWRRIFPLGSEARTTIELAYLGGLRRSDIGRVGPGHIFGRDGSEWQLEWREHKNRNRDPKDREAVLFNELRAALNAAERAMPKDARHWVDLARTTKDESQRGPHWIENMVEKAFLKWRAHAEVEGAKLLGVRKLDLKHLTLHGLRAGGAVRLARMGWTPHEIMGWGGWTNIKQVMKYTEDLDRQETTNDKVRAHNSAPARARLRVVGGGSR